MTENKGDLISREVLKNDLMTFFPDKCLEGITAKTLFKQILTDIDNAPTVEPERPQGNLISREALLKRVDEERKYLIARGQTGAEHILVHNFRDLIDNAPTVEGEILTEEAYSDLCLRASKLRPQGKWEEHSFYKDAIICSNCNVGGNIYYKDFKFCPNCGAMMK